MTPTPVFSDAMVKRLEDYCKEDLRRTPGDEYCTMVLGVIARLKCAERVCEYAKHYSPVSEEDESQSDVARQALQSIDEPRKHE